MLGVAAAESRSLRRSLRGRLVGALITGFVVVLFGLYANLHGHAQALLPTSYLAPRFLVYELGIYPLWLALVAIVCLAIDSERRDTTAGVADVVDSRPLSNFALRAGRLIGTVATVWIPLVLGFVVIQIVGAITALPARLNFEAVEPVSLATFLVLDALPVLVLWCSVVLLVASWLPNRLVVGLVSLIMLAVATSIVSNSPAYLLQASSPVSVRGFASDLAPRTADVWVLCQRVSIIVFAVGLLALASVFGRRVDVVRPVRSWVTFAFFAGGGVAGVGAVASGGLADVEQRRNWLEAHKESFRAGNDRFDVESIVGQVSIDPGVSLALDIQMVVSVAQENLSRLVFSLRIGSKQVELLADARHLRNLEHLYHDQLPAVLQAYFEDAADAGFPYPYEALTVVEAPPNLRSHHGGRLLDSALTLPGVLIIKETTATVRFERQLAMFTRWSNNESAKLRILNSFFQGDDHGIDLERGFASILAGQLHENRASHYNASGALDVSNPSQARSSLDLLIHYLVYRAIVARSDLASTPRVFSAHNFDQDAGLAALLLEPASIAFKQRLPVLAHTSSVIDRPDVWEVLERSLPMGRATGRRAEAAYASALAAMITGDAIINSLGHQSTARLLADLRDRSRARPFDSIDFANAIDKLGTYDLRIVSDAGVVTPLFDGAAALPGWNKIGDFHLGAGRVAVMIGLRSSGQLIVADAIRWLPSDAGAG